MEDEKLLPLGEPTLHFPPPSVGPVPKSGASTETPSPTPGVPSPKAQQWGVLISIVIIVLMVIIGAFYAWGERIAEENALLVPPAVN